MDALGLYVYGIVRTGHRLDLGHRGVGAPPAPVRLLRADSLAAVVSRAPERLRARRRDLLAHHDLLLALAEEGPVLPMRFGMVSDGHEAVLGQLAIAQRDHLRALARLDGRVELNLKALPAEGGLAALVREDAAVRQLREDARRQPGHGASLRLGEAVVAGLTRRAGQAAAAVLRQLAPLAEETVRGPDTADCVLNVSFLVERAACDRFREAFDRYAEEQRDRVVLRLTGPLPCYSFVAPETASAPARAGLRTGA